MILNHLWSLYAHAKDPQTIIDKQHESLHYSLIHILTIALIPTICFYYAAAYIGWTIGVGEPITIKIVTAKILSVCLYLILVFGVFLLAVLIRWLAKVFHSTSGFIQAFELATYTATPLLIVGVTALFPVLWFVVLSGIIAIAYSIYLLYSGVPIMMNIPEEKSFIYFSSVVICGLVLFIFLVLLAATVSTIGISTESFH